MISVFRRGDFSFCWTFKMGTRGCPETLVTNYQSMLRNTPEEWRSQLSLWKWSFWIYFTDLSSSDHITI